MGDDNAVERAALLSVHLVINNQRGPQVVIEMLRSMLQVSQPDRVRQALGQALVQHAAGCGNLHELERGMRSDEQTQLGHWAKIAEKLPLRSGDDDIEWLWTRSDGSPPQDFVCVKVRLKAALVLQHFDVTERDSNQDPFW